MGKDDHRKRAAVAREHNAQRNAPLLLGIVKRIIVDGDDRMITYLDASAQEYMEIYWNAADGSGYLIAPHYNGGAKACWDASQQDIACG